MTIDLLPTIAKLAGQELPARRIDGLDMWPSLRGDARATTPHEAFFFYDNTNELQAVRSGKWKLIQPHTYRTLGDQPRASGGIPLTKRVGVGVREPGRVGERK